MITILKHLKISKPILKVNKYQRIILALLLPLITTFFLISCEKTEQTGQNENPTTMANEILEKIDVSRGICVILGDRKCELSKELVMLSELVLYVQLEKEMDVRMARIAADDAGFYGSRIYVEQDRGNKIHLADNIADPVTQIALIRLDETEGRGYGSQSAIRHAIRSHTILCRVVGNNTVIEGQLPLVENATANAKSG